MTLHYAILTTDTNQAKSFSLADGKLVKTSIANSTRGNFSAHTCETLNEFAIALNSITIKQSLILGGIVRQDGTQLAPGEKIALTVKDKPKPNAVARSKDFVKNLKQPGFILFDLDGNDYSLPDIKQFIPELDGVGAVVKPSSSSMIYDSEGNQLIGNKGRHIFVPVQDMSDIERIAAIFWGRQWLAGHGHYLISHGIHPMLLERGIYDKTVLGYSERLAFEAKPILQDGLQQLNNQAVVADGFVLDTRLIPDLTQDQIEQINSLKSAARQKIRPTYEAEITTKKKEYLASGKSLTDWENLKRRVLPRDFELQTINGLLLASELNGKHNGITLKDPFEPDYDGGSLTKAKFYWNDGDPKIYSQAHGGIVYTLEPKTVAGEVCREDDWIAHYKALVAEFNRTHWQVIIGGKYRVMRRLDAKYTGTGRDGYEFISRETMTDIYTNTSIQTGWNNQGHPVYKNHYEAWAKHNASNVYRGGLFFKPSVTPIDSDGWYFNTWEGYAVQPAEKHELLALIKYHIEEIMCGGAKDQIEYFYNWIAYSFQYPDRPAGSAIVCRGDEGVGKGIIGHFLKNLWGKHGAHISSSTHLTGNFNGHLTDICFLFADEAFYSGDKAGENRLKSLITEPKLMVERKGVDAVAVDNYLKIFMCTNHDYAVPATKGVRRFCVLDISSEKKGNTAYFADLNRDTIDSEVRAAFLHEMLHRDISGYHSGKIPDTVGLKAQRQHSLCSVGKWLIDSFYQGFFETLTPREQSKRDYTPEWMNEVPAHVLILSYQLWCDSNKIGEYGRKTATAMGKYLKDIGYEKRKSSGMIRAFGSLSDAIVLFEQYEKVSLDK